MSMIEIDNLVKHFGHGENIVKAVDGIDFSVEEGEIHGFLGPNGAGKSTTIKMVVGSLIMTSGTIRIKGHKAGTRDANRMLGFSPDHPKFYDMSLYDYLVYMGRLGGLNRTTAEKNTLDIISLLELEDSVFRKVNGFSAGMRQKVGLAQALVHEPEVILLDEPTANLDPIGRSRIIDTIKKLAREKDLTVMVSSHVLAEIEKMADRVTIINKGKIILTDNVKHITSEYAGNHYIISIKEKEHLKNIARKLLETGYVKKITLDEDKDLHVSTEYPDELCKVVPRIIAEQNITLYNFNSIKLSLENIFLRAVGEKEGFI